MNFQQYVTSTTANLFLVAIKYLGDAGSVSTFGHLCVAGMKVDFKRRKKRHSCPCFCWFAAAAWVEGKTIAGNGQTPLLLFIKLIYLRHAGNQFNDQKHLPTYHFLNIGSSCILQDLCCRILTILKNWFIFEHIVLFTVYKGKNLSWSTSPKVMKSYCLHTFVQAKQGS